VFGSVLSALNIKLPKYGYCVDVQIPPGKGNERARVLATLAERNVEPTTLAPDLSAIAKTSDVAQNSHPHHDNKADQSDALATVNNAAEVPAPAPVIATNQKITRAITLLHDTLTMDAALRASRQRDSTKKELVELRRMLELFKTAPLTSVAQKDVGARLVFLAAMEQLFTNYDDQIDGKSILNNYRQRSVADLETIEGEYKKIFDCVHLSFLQVNLTFK
jgi:hypothetical protein